MKRCLPRHRWFPVLLSIAAGACSADLGVDPRARITCSTNDDCPTGTTCRARLGRCVAVDAHEVLPAITDFSINPTKASRRSGHDTVTIEFTLNVDVGLEPPELEVTVAAHASTACTKEANGRYRCTYEVTDDDTEGVKGVVVDVIDPFGNPARATGEVLFDFSPPELSFATVSYVPASNSALPRVKYATVGSNALVTVVADEELAPTGAGMEARHASGAPTLSLSPETTATTATSLAFSLTVPGATPDGLYDIVVTWLDDVGNTGEVTIDSPPLAIKSSLPEAVIDQASISYVRSPWGNDEEEDLGSFVLPAGPYFALAPAAFRSSATTLAAATLQMGTVDLATGSAVTTQPRLVRLWADTARSTLLATMTANGDGSWPRLTLPPIDAVTVYVSVVDEAGNESSTVAIESTHFVVTPRASTPGLPDNDSRVRSVIEATDRRDTDVDAAVHAVASAHDGMAAVARAEGSWKVTRRTSSLPTAGGRMIAYDTIRGRVVAFGGSTGTTLNQTWEYRAGAWEQRLPVSDIPPARSVGAATFDSVRAETLVFGGVDDLNAELDDFWVWNGDAWRQIPTSTPWPPARRDATMTFDAERGRAVLFGGRAESAPLGDLWEWDGDTWEQRVFTAGPTTGPEARFWSASTFDAARERVVLFGGWGVSGWIDDLWEWDGSTWYAPAGGTSGPTKSDKSGLLYDASLGGSLFVDDAGLHHWIWNGESWSSSSITKGFGLSEITLLFDGSRGSLLGIGQYLWRFDERAAGWMVEQGSPNAPESVTHVASDRVGARVFLVSVVEVWAWDRGWSTLYGSGLGATSANYFWMQYDPDANLLVRVGQTLCLSRPCTPLAVSQTWDSVNDWSSALDGPSSYSQGALAYYPGLVAGAGRVVYLGGEDPANAANSPGPYLFETATSTWADATASGTNPPRRLNGTLAYHADLDELILFGGDGFNDMWAWNGTSWRSIASTGPLPPPRDNYQMVYDDDRGTLVAFAGFGDGFGTETWEWDGAGWTRMASDFFDPGDGRVAYDASMGRVARFRTGSQGVEVWHWHRNPQRKPALQFDVDVDAARLVDPAQIEGLSVRAYCGGRFSPFGSSDTGAALYGWSSGGAGVGAGRFVPSSGAAASNDAGINDTPPELSLTDTEVSWRAADAIEAHRFVTNGAAAFQCRPRGGSGDGIAEVAMDAVEVVITYGPPP